MRITNGMMINSMLSNLNQGLLRVDKYHNQLASNRRIVKLSDDPVGVLNSLGARQQIRRLAQYQRNVTYSRSWIKSTEAAVTELQELFVDARELLTDAMGTETPSDKKIFATQMRQTLENILEVCNTSIGDKYVFGGFNVTKAPFTAERDENGNITNVLYNGLDLSGKNIVQDKDGGAIQAKDLEKLGIENLKWTGSLDIPGSYTVKVGEPENIDPEDKFSDTRTPLLITDQDGKEYKAFLSDIPKSVDKDNQKITLDLKTEDGVSFGKVSWVQTDKEKMAEVSESASKIVEALATRNNGELQTTSEANKQPVTGPNTNASVIWNGTIADPTEKYTIQVEGTTLNFINSKGSVVGTHTIRDDTLQKKNGNGNYQIDIDTGNPDLKLGPVEINPLALMDPQDANAFDKNAEALGLTKAEYAAQLIGSSEYVTSALGEEATQRIQFEIGFEMKMDVTYTGIDLAGLGDNNIFDMMINICDDLEAGIGNEDLTKWLTPLINTQDRLLTQVVKSGNRTQKLDTMDNRYSRDAIDYEATRSDIEDIDQAKVITQMKYAEMIYKQALASGAQIIQPTLMDYLH